MKSPDHQDNATLGITLVITAMFIFSLQDAITKTLAVTYSVPQILWIRFVFYIFFCTGDFCPQETITRLLKK